MIAPFIDFLMCNLKYIVMHSVQMYAGAISKSLSSWIIFPYRRTNHTLTYTYFIFKIYNGKSNPYCTCYARAYQYNLVAEHSQSLIFFRHHERLNYKILQPGVHVDTHDTLVLHSSDPIKS